MSFRRMLPFVLINVVVSAVVVLSILYWWGDRQSEERESDSALAVLTATAPAVANPGEFLVEATATPETAEGPTIYTVRAGDTLGSISRSFDVPMDDIITINAISNPNVLFVGQELVIPIGGIPTATPEPAPTATADVLPSPIPTEPLGQGEVIVEITEVIGAGRLTEEAISVANFGTRAVALEGWKLSDEQGHVYTFGRVTLFGDGAAILVHTERGQDGPADLYWGLEQAVWQPGETVTLTDAEGTVQATLVVGNQ